MKQIIKYILLTILSMGMMTLCSAAIRIQVPTTNGNNQSEINYQGNTILSEQTNNKTSSVRVKVLQTANEYLRVGLVVTLLAVVVITGAKLMAGKHEENGTALLNALVALLIAIFSYTIIKILVNLF